MSTFREWKRVIDIFASVKGGEDQYFETYAGHDLFMSSISTDLIPEDSDLGKELDKLGWHVDDEHWSKYT